MKKELLHPASCVAIKGVAVLIEGSSGSGKSSLALALIDRGAILVSDDITVIHRHENVLIAYPAPNIVGKIEIRNLGIAELPSRDAPIALSVRLDTNAPRFIESAETQSLLGQDIPLVSLFPDTPHLALRTEWALRLYGAPQI